MVYQRHRGVATNSYRVPPPIQSVYVDVGSDTRSAHVHGDVMEKEKPLDDDETTDEMR